jgi:putative ABC transport system permease protein
MNPPRLAPLAQDLRQGIRRLRLQPGFSIVVALTLAMGIGASTALFSVINAVMLRPLPFVDDRALVMLNACNPDRTQIRFGTSWPDFRDWREQTRSFAGMSLFTPGSMVLQSPEGPDRVGGLFVESNFFDLLGIKPALGRLFGPDDARGESSASVVLSYGYWQERFGGERSVLGRTIEVNGRPRTIIGVLPRDAGVLGPAFLGERLGVVTVIELSSYPRVDNHAQHLFLAIGRLKPGVSLAAAQADLYATEVRIAQANPVIAGWTAGVFDLRGELAVGVQEPLFVLLAAAGLVLLIGCINVANLLLARGAARTRELALRLALGATRGRLVVQLLTESLLLACAGGLLGVLLAGASLGPLRRLIPAGLIARTDEISLDPRVAVWAVGLSLLAALLAGLWPALRISSPALAEALKGGARGSTAGPETRRLRRMLVIGEVALALMLLVSAGLVVESLVRMRQVDPGFQPDHVLTVQLSLGGGYPDTTQVPLYRTILSDLEGRPGVVAAGITDTPPLVSGGFFTSIRLIGMPPRPPGQPLMSSIVAVTPGLFRALGQPLLAGRDVEWGDGAPRMILSEAAARAFWPGADPVGHRIGLGPDTLGNEIIGVARDTRRISLATPPAPVVYVSLSRYARLLRSVTLVVRGRGEPASVVAAIRGAVHDADPTLPLYSVTSMQEIVDQSLAQPRLEASLLVLFGVAALLLAALGIYAVISYAVTARQQELGVRLALGATRGDLLRLVLGEALTLALAGTLLGALGAAAATRLLDSWLFGVGRTDPLTFGATAAALVGVGLLAAYAPARRAARADPLVALRAD